MNVVETSEDIVPLVEAIIFAHGDPLEVARIVELLNRDNQDLAKHESYIEAVNVAIEKIRQRYLDANYGIELVSVRGGVQFRTKGTFADIVRELKQEKPRRLSMAALETLSIIAYRQPIVKSDVERIRGVDATPTIKTLLERSIIKIVGHQQTVGLPALYGTTDDFLKLFGLSSLAELPTLRDLTEIDSDPGESEEEPVGAEPLMEGTEPQAVS